MKAQRPWEKRGDKLADLMAESEPILETRSLFHF